MAKKKVVKKTAKKRKATKKKAAPKKKGLSSGLDDTFQNWVDQQVALMNKKKR